MYTRCQMFYHCSHCGAGYEKPAEAERCEAKTPPKPCEPGDRVVVGQHEFASPATVRDVRLEPLWRRHPGHGWKIYLHEEVQVNTHTRTDVVTASLIKEKK